MWVIRGDTRGVCGTSVTICGMSGHALKGSQVADSRDDAEAVGRQQANPSFRKQVVRLRQVVGFLAAFLAVYLLAVCTPIGQRAENALIVGRADQATLFRWRQSLPPLTRGTAVLAAAVVLIVAVTVIRRCWREGVSAVAIVVVTFGAAEALHAVLPRPSLRPAPPALTGASFPSGSVAIAAGVALGVAVVSSPRARPYVAAVGAIWIAVIAASVQAFYWHRPSDVLGATLLACACHATATGLLAPVGTRRLRALPPLALAAAGALLASTREDSVARPLVFAGVALACSTLVWITATGMSIRIAQRLG
jgi:membrane-associated phospholipid phosphatase